MTLAQEQALERIHDLMREHFESGVVIVETDDIRDMAWHGGISTAVGACQIAIARLQKRIVTDDTEHQL